METVILKNSTNNILPIDDLGIRIAASGERNMTEEFSQFELYTSDDLDNLLDNGDIVMNNGIVDMSANAAKIYILPHGKMSPDGAVWEIKIDNAGVLSSTKIIT